ncbi:Thioredoxin domain-containing protein [Pyrenophora tritici-repentis]|uniref:Protein disulfide-isomerase n=1 Tax=Pyrenophora tritici-repentis TaxID=45151 RepID=A0A2W1I4F6_9PLEO|nr:Protein disulfide-isomerase [Pyrenophora tritici-repentis]KAF7445138.1 Protein disulfide-isomerase [Pyrenophora tritici-repentis]KAF7565405.1 Thioredoxin domain-containing protein [Pyrenophora tritici-repentis]KAG9380457.1 Protein disulfide-isomerase [Pyrenophora tritici-repentis]KAI0581438.1 Protein disulfide-isomerase [Pyrenophora tritici-repentis]
MKYATVCATLFAALAGASDVKQLKTDNFKSFIEENDLVLAEFFAPWCGHCKALAPEYETAATTLKEKDIALVKVDCTEEQDLCQEYGVEGYPTLKVFRGLENISPYGGQRKADSLISYMTKQSLPAVSEITKDTLEEFKTADKVVLVAYFAADDKAANETFTSVANGLRDNYLFGATNDAALAKAEGVKQPGLVLYKSFDSGKDIFKEKFEADAIRDFAKIASTPLIGEVGPETYAGYMDAGLPLAYIFAETQEERDAFAKELKPLALKHKGKINFATIDAKSFGQHAGNLNLKVGTWPAFAIQTTTKNQKFPYDQEAKITEKEIGKFVDQYLAGKLEPSIKSEPIPEKNDGPVTTIVAHNYKDVVLDNDKDVLVEFYAPWCGHCKALAPKYEELGQLYQTPEFSKLVTIAKVDATANDVPDEIQGFPTIKLFAAGKKDAPVDYSGSRTIEDLIEFVKENGSHKVSVTYTPSEEGMADKLAHQAPAATKKGANSATDATKDAEASASSATDKAASAASEATDSAKSGAAAATDSVKSAASDVKDEL